MYFFIYYNLFSLDYFRIRVQVYLVFSWFIVMDLLKIEFGVEMKKECFYFEEGYVFVNYVVYGEVFVLM